MMTITLVRHLKVDFHWTPFPNAREFERDCDGYNEAPVTRPPFTRAAGVPIWTSSMRRAVDTARFLFGREPDRIFSLIAEVPMRPFIKTTLPLPRLVWDACARLQWLFGVGNQPETYKDTARRVEYFIDELLRAGTDCIIVSHGWVLKVIIRRLIALGFRGPRPVYLGNGVPFTYRR